jgi:TolB-like protein
MTEPASPDRVETPTESPMTGPSFAARVRDHKLIQWGIAYLGAALALAQAQQFVAVTFDWPEWVGRALIISLIVGLPIALTVAWYHGHRGLQRITAGELWIISLLMLIGAVFFAASIDEPRSAVTGTPSSNSAASESRLERNVAAPAAAAEAGADSLLPNSVAVLPFDNLSPNENDEYFAAGIHEQVLNHLAKIEDVTVIARTSVLRYAEGDRAIPDIARALNVETILEGSVRYADGNVRITAQLIDAATQAHLWSETYTRPFQNVFEIETDIATQIAAALQAELAPEERQTIAKQPTQSAEAYALYLRAIAGIDSAFGGLGVSAAASERLHRDLDRALELDPKFALARAVKARDYAYSIGRRLERVGSASPEERSALARWNAERALELDSELGLAHAALSIVHRFDWRRREARLALERALALSPNDPQVLFDAIVLYTGIGEVPIALELAERVARLSPADAAIARGIAYWRAGRLDEAAEQFGSSPSARGEPVIIEMLRGNREAALRHLRRIEATRLTTVSLGGMAYQYSLLGAQDDARRLATAQEPWAEQYYVGPADRALAALALGDKGGAIRWIERSANEPAPGPDWGAVRLIFENMYDDPVLDEPEFAAVRSRLGWR